METVELEDGACVVLKEAAVGLLFKFVAFWLRTVGTICDEGWFYLSLKADNPGPRHEFKCRYNSLIWIGV